MERVWLIFKAGRGWYRPKQAGYTKNPADAARYTWDQAWQLSHPNGPDGSRDGMTIYRETELLRATV
jgi:hypothetical protein